MTIHFPEEPPAIERKMPKDSSIPTIIATIVMAVGTILLFSLVYYDTRYLWQ